MEPYDLDVPYFVTLHLEPIYPEIRNLFDNSVIITRLQLRLYFSLCITPLQHMNKTLQNLVGGGAWESPQNVSNGMSHGVVFFECETPGITCTTHGQVGDTIRQICQLNDW